MIGIYKITNPKGKIYIGQSVSIKKRWRQYRGGGDKSQRKIYNSLVKYGFSKHIFEVMEECEEDQLNVRERHWQDFYDVLGPNGLNLRLTQTDDRSGHCSQETRDRIGDVHRGKVCTEEQKRKQRESMIGRKASEETKQKQSTARLLSGQKPPVGIGGDNPRALRVVDTATGISYSCAKHAAEAIGILPGTLLDYLHGRIKKNKTAMIFEEKLYI
jgi:group I intron endonuclease